MRLRCSETVCCERRLVLSAALLEDQEEFERGERAVEHGVGEVIEGDKLRVDEVDQVSSVGGNKGMRHRMLLIRGCG